VSNYKKNLKHIHELLKTTDDLTLRKTNLSKKEVRYLQAKDLMIRDAKHEYHDGDMTLMLTPKGITYFDDKKQELKDRLIWSVFTPISLSVVTTLMTLWINHLLK